MSGPRAHAILKTIFRPAGRVRSFASHRLHLGRITDPATGADVDEVFAVAMKAPRTYTREPMAEVYSHGGFAAQQSIVALMLRQGARLAAPGEFTRRAFLNGRIDLTQAESVLDIIESEDEEELRCALMQAGGALSGRIRDARARIASILAEAEAEIDFPHEDIDTGADTRADRIGVVRDEIARLAASYEAGRAVRHGVDVLIVGRTNVGKSSLLNALVERERAIVTPIPGTTRDLVEDSVRILGHKFTFTDTAGFREPGDAIEEEGLARVRRRLPEADIILWVMDACAPPTPDDEEVARAVAGRKTVAVLNKADLVSAREAAAARFAPLAGDALFVSALTGEGTDALKNRLHEVFTSGLRRGAALVVTNARHADGLAGAAQALARACACIRDDEPAELAAFELRDALFRLDELTGEAAPADLLDEIFGRFCIGK
jgi:tRNA modification GTPase